MAKAVIKALDRDGQPIELLPDIVDLLGIGIDVFRKDHVSFADTLTYFRDMKEIQPEYRSYRSHLEEVRRFEFKMIPDFYEGFEDEDPEKVFHAGYFKNTDGEWTFEIDTYEEYLN